MSGQVKKIQSDNGQPAPSSLEAWQEFGIQEIQLTEQLSVKVYPIDVVAKLSRGDDDNPLLSIVAAAVQGSSGDEVGPKLMEDPKTLAALSEKIDEILIEVMVSPPLIEQGDDEGISIGRIPFEHKMTIFNHLMGGSQLDQLEKFRGGQSSPVVNTQKGKRIREDAERTAED